MLCCLIIIIILVIFLIALSCIHSARLYGGKKPSDLPLNLYPRIEEKHTYSFLTKGMINTITRLYNHSLETDGYVNPERKRLFRLASSLQSASRANFQNTFCYTIPNDDVYAIGDIHGDLRSLLLALEKCKEHPNARIIFLGDYVDKGLESIECLEILAELKNTYHSQIYLCRGNHENAGSPEDEERMNVSKVSPIVDVVNRFRHSNSLSDILYLYDAIARFYSTLTPSFICGDNLFLHGFIPKDREFIDVPLSEPPKAVIPFGTITNDITYATFKEYDRKDNWRHTSYCDENDVMKFSAKHPRIKRMIKAHMHEYSMQHHVVGALDIITINSCLLPTLVDKIPPSKPYDPWYYSCIAYIEKDSDPILLSNEPYETRIFQDRIESVYKQFFIERYGAIPKFNSKGLRQLLQ